MAKFNQNRLVFLFGSGISIPAGMPSIWDIINRVLSGRDVFLDGEDFSSEVRPFTAKELEDVQHEDIRRIVKFLNILKVEIDYYYKKFPFKYCLNYEDLYYMARQIYDSQTGNYDNPAIQALVDKISSDLKPILANIATISQCTLSQLAKLTMKYIEFVLSREFRQVKETLDYLECIKGACENENFTDVDIFTLNHDTILEEFLNNNNIKFTDGFSKSEEKQLRYWNSTLFECKSFDVRLFKLHGSINWFRYVSLQSDDSRGDSIISIENPNIALIKNSDGTLLGKPDKSPMILIGTYNKMLDYGSGIYRELHYQFFNALKETNQLIICGYGLGDRGINTQIVDWLYSSDNRRIILIDPKPEKLQNKYLSSLSKKWDSLISTKKLEIMPTGIEDVSWQELRETLLRDTQKKSYSS